jgi:hypothetical protein
MILNPAIDPWCQYSIFLKTASMSLVTERPPLPVSVIEIVLGVIEYVKSACVTGLSTSLKSRVIAWYGDIEKCTQMNTLLPGIFGDGNRSTSHQNVSTNRRSADVVTGTEFRRYFSGLSGPQYERGFCFYTASDVKIIDYPKQHSANCTTKHQATNEWFKPMVRIMNKRAQQVSFGWVDQGGKRSIVLS